MKPSKAALWKAIRRFCAECMGGSVAEAERCTAPKCSLYDFRRGMDHPSYHSGRKATGKPFKKAVDDAAGAGITA
jgi:hypothetical protein